MSNGEPGDGNHQMRRRDGNPTVALLSEPTSKKNISIKLGFREYLRRRGYKVPLQASDVIWVWWFQSFAQPSFAQFWRVWNPFIGFWLHKLYRKLGGDRRRPVACVVTFTFAGFCHDLFNLAMDPKDGIEPELTIAFLFWSGTVLLLSSRTALRIQRRFPPPVHVALNLIWLVLGLILGAKVT